MTLIIGLNDEYQCHQECAGVIKGKRETVHQFLFSYRELLWKVFSFS
jgi:hypothetical protein